MLLCVLQGSVQRRSLLRKCLAAGEGGGSRGYSSERRAEQGGRRADGVHSQLSEGVPRLSSQHEPILHVPLTAFLAHHSKDGTGKHQGPEFGVLVGYPGAEYMLGVGKGAPKQPFRNPEVLQR